MGGINSNYSSPLNLGPSLTAVIRKQKADHKMKNPSTLFEKIRSIAMGSLQQRVRERERERRKKLPLGQGIVLPSL